VTAAPLSDACPPIVDEQNLRLFALGCGDVNPRWSGGGTVIVPPLFGVCALGTLGQLTPGHVPRWRHLALELAGELEGPERLSADVELSAAPARDGDLRGDGWTVRLHLSRSDGSAAGLATVVVASSGDSITQGREPRPYDKSVIEAVEDAQLDERHDATFLASVPPSTTAELPVVVRGPYNAHDAAFYFAGAGFRWHCGRTWGEPERAYFEDVAAREHGFPLPVCPSGLQAAWAATAVTNVLGDGWYLQRLELDLVAPVLLGDVVWTSATAVGSGDGHRVDIRITSKDQEDSEVTTGRATVRREEGHRAR
jgi:hypothetical protein